MALNLYLAIREARGMSASEKSVIYSLAAHCNRVTPNKAWPSIPTLADEAGLSVRSAQRAIKQLVKLGWITVRSVNKPRGGFSNNVYTIHPPMGGAMVTPPGRTVTPPGVMVTSEVSKEVSKTKLNTGERPEASKPNSEAARQLVDWWISEGGAGGVDVMALERDPTTGRGARGDHIDAQDAERHNAAGMDILIRPSRGTDHALILLDDLSAQAVREVANRWRTAIIETSAENYQAWIACSRVMNESERKLVQRLLAATFDADPGSTSGEHWGRAPGFRNMKPERNRFIAHLICAADTGKLLDTDSALAQAVIASPLAANHQPSHRAPSLPSRSRSSGRDESAAEFGWAVGALGAGAHPDDVTARLIEHAAPRRGKDARRYAVRTVEAAGRVKA